MYRSQKPLSDSDGTLVFTARCIDCDFFCHDKRKAIAHRLLRWHRLETSEWNVKVTVSETYNNE